jgi:hypothetical protein
VVTRRVADPVCDQEVSNGFDTQMHSLRTADWSTQLVGPPNLTLSPPAWSPDGTRILFENATNLSWMYANGYRSMLLLTRLAATPSIVVAPG